jgi:hypothetical protein
MPAPLHEAAKQPRRLQAPIGQHHDRPARGKGGAQQP